LLDALQNAPNWPLQYLRWEMQLLEELGFGLDLTSCAVTGSRDDLAYVSPKTGRAVSRGAAGDWVARLLPLPVALLGQGPADRAEVAQGLALTGHFLTRELTPMLNGRPLPDARARLIDLLSRQAG
jgi:DNA repair protein RecO (recombination protein O)